MDEFKTNDELVKLIATVQGLQLALGVVADLVPNKAELVDRLKAMEETSRKQNYLSETTEMLRVIRKHAGG